MKAVNLTMQSVELDPANGPGLLAPAVPESEGAHERELKEVTARENALAAAGTIALLDGRGHQRSREEAATLAEAQHLEQIHERAEAVVPPPPPPPDGDGADQTGGEG